MKLIATSNHSSVSDRDKHFSRTHETLTKDGWHKINHESDGGRHGPYQMKNTYHKSVNGKDMYRKLETEQKDKVHHVHHHEYSGEEAHARAKKVLGESYITEIKAKVKRSYRGTKRARTDTGQRANPIELKPVVSMIGKDMKR